MATENSTEGTQGNVGPTDPPENSGNNSGKRGGNNPQNIKPHQFKPGQTGNPGGRPRKLFTEAALKLGKKRHKEDKEKRTFAELAIRGMFNEAIKGNVQAFMALADRLEGKPMQGLEVSGPQGAPMQFENVDNPAENEKRIAELLAKSGLK